MAYAFASYGEQVLVLAQNVLLVVLAHAFAAPPRPARAAASAAAMAAAAAAAAATPVDAAWVLSGLSVAAREPTTLAPNGAGVSTGWSGERTRRT